MLTCEAGPREAFLMSCAKESGLHPEDEVSLQSLFRGQCGPGPELGCGMNTKWATQVGAQ